jgi:hypothetical protein
VFITSFLLAYHTSMHASTKCTPFVVMYAGTSFQIFPGSRGKYI